MFRYLRVNVLAADRLGVTCLQPGRPFPGGRRWRRGRSCEPLGNVDTEQDFALFDKARQSGLPLAQVIAVTR